MKIYNYDVTTGEYLNESTACKSPLAEGEFLIPANATQKPVLETLENQVAVFANNEWIIKEDHRGKTVYSTETTEESTIDYIGVIKEAFTELIPCEYPKWDNDKWIVDETVKAKTEQEVINSDARAYLASTDWYIIRSQETGEEVPVDVLAKRVTERERVITL